MPPEGDGCAVYRAVALAEGAPTALRWTKQALNSWLRVAMPHFDAALATEFLGFAGTEIQEGLSALRQQRRPTFST
jgi:enoyl-CoA hydratase